jgi:hypothetical protein
MTFNLRLEQAKNKWIAKCLVWIIKTMSDRAIGLAIAKTTKFSKAIISKTLKK